MAFRFSRDGASFPCYAENGELVVVVGDDLLRIPVGFIKEDYPYDYTDFSTSNIMCYMENDEYSLVMRFDGTITKYTKDDIVIGFTKFDRYELIYSKMIYLPVGAFRYPDRDTLYKCSIYHIKNGTGRWVLTISGSRVLHIFDPQVNQKLVFEILQGNRYYPGLTYDMNGHLCDDTFSYLVQCEYKEPVESRNI